MAPALPGDAWEALLSVCPCLTHRKLVFAVTPPEEPGRPSLGEDSGRDVSTWGPGSGRGASGWPWDGVDAGLSPQGTSEGSVWMCVT